MSVRRHIDHFLHDDPMMSPEDRGRVRIFLIMLLLGIVIWWLMLSAAFAGTVMIPHPKGCPARAFCACGACVDVMGNAKACPWLARAWFKYPRTAPKPNAVAVRRGHVFVLKQHVRGNIWMVADYNSGGHRSRYHARSIAGYRIVDPQARIAEARQ